MYKVIKFFTDLHDNSYAYNEGDTYPREGVKVTDERIAELSGSNNLQGEPLIAAADGIDVMKIDELKAYAEEKGINIEGVTRKADILAKIKEAEAAAE